MVDETTVSHVPPHAEPPRKAELLDRVAAYLLDNGLDDLSLRPLAAALGVSPRTLLYYFGSKERMLVDALD
ncbi:MAG: TetR/AcrR family transcriptional regulator, partial [Dehalococcoidia bacterium]